MLNLLRYAERAAGEPGKTGAESYGTYGEKMGEIMAQRGIKLLWRGRADSVVIGDDDADAWDEVLLVEYPSRKAFLEMATSKGVREGGRAQDGGFAGLTADRLHRAIPGLIAGR